MNNGRPTNDNAQWRANIIRERDTQFAELNAKHQQVVKFYQDRAAEDAQTISELAAKVDALEKAAGFIVLNRRNFIIGDAHGIAADAIDRVAALLPAQCPLCGDITGDCLHREQYEIQERRP